MLNKFAVISIMRKAARCWAGYEPVPGAKAYSEGSCRPKGSKKTKKEVIQGKKHTEKKSSGPGTGSFTIGTQQRAPKVNYTAPPLTSEQLNKIVPVLQQHPRYANISAENPRQVHSAARAMFSLPDADPAILSGLRQAGIPGLHNFPGFPAPPTTPPAVAQAKPPAPPKPPQPARPPKQPDNYTPIPGPQTNRPTLSAPKPSSNSRPTMSQMGAKPVPSPIPEWGGK